MSDAGQPEEETEVAPEDATPAEPVIGSPPDEGDLITGSEEEPEPEPEPEEEPGPAAEPGPEVEAAEPKPAAGPEPEVVEREPEVVEPEPDPVLAVVESLLPDLAATAREETLSTGLAGIQKGLDEMVRLTRRADEHVAELHAENQRLRGGELAGALQPMLRDLVRLHDEVTRLAEASHPEAQADLDLVRSRLLDTLARWGLTPFAPEPGEPLDATRHQGVGRVPSSDGEPGTIATVRRPGFAHDDGRTFRAAEVEVFAPPPAPPAPTDDQTDTEIEES